MVPWAVAAVLCAPLALSLLVFSLLVDPGVVLPPERGGYVEFPDRDHAPPPEDAPEDAKVLRGVVFAASGLAYAITGPKRLPGKRVELVVLSKGIANLLHFSLLIDPVIVARPDFVIVQSTLLVATTRNTPPNATGAARFFWRHRVLAWMPRLARSDPHGRVMPLSRRHPKALPMEQWQDYVKRLAGKIMPLVDRRRDRTRAILHRFAEVGIPVLVVTPPGNEFTEVYHARVSEEARSTVDPATGAAAIFFLEPSRLWPNEQFADPLHIDRSQAESYRAWLSAAILATLGN